MDTAKRAAAEFAVTYIEDKMTVGLGTGSTVYFFIKRLGELVRGGKQIQAVATSLQTEQLARANNITLMNTFVQVDITIDGADEVDGSGNLIKGGGGALTREKIVAAASTKEIIVVDQSKRVDKLGKFPLPIEVLPFGWKFVSKVLRDMGCEVKLRMDEHVTFLTDNKNYILDCSFGVITDPDTLVLELNAIPGVVENGLFTGLCDLIIIGSEDGTIEEISF